MQNAFAQWTFRAAPQPLISNITVTANSPAAGTNTLIASTLVVVTWGAFLRSGTIETLWPLLGVANQLLATTALCVGTAVIINSGKRKYAFVTGIPMLFLGTTTLTAGYLSITDNFLKLGTTAGRVDAAFTAILMAAAVAIFVEAAYRFTIRRPMAQASAA